ncbi:hypothetical protein E8E13_001909 [Curvularia kusanoi]|uniref:PLD phosphodiesterase domain-containing protein n=1 Tax=Curvularia kusanoi TaxID=90978 RepID=A0A9P4T4H5_CURKU|nr:hypothetical protein E8E13_001909 [Curvularia kusanoi]
MSSGPSQADGDPQAPSPLGEGMSEKYQEPFVNDLEREVVSTERDDPNYYSRLPRSLITTSNVISFRTGTGSSIYEELSINLEDTEHELIIVTCFWAPSVSRDRLNAALRALSDKAVRRGAGKIRVRLCFSSSSLFQKLFHKQTVNGQTYRSTDWVKKFGLPHPAELGGLDMKIKSVFMLPFSVMHPKFIIIDRELVILPSCNVSWEEWFECAISMTGPVVSQFLNFYWTFWERRSEPPPDLPVRGRVYGILDTGAEAPTKFWSADQSATSDFLEIPTIFLPSPHRRNPNFRIFGAASSPATPLNLFLLNIFAKAERSIRIQTPNLTAPPVLSALLKALARGVDVKIVTSERLMILEQLVTAGTTTSRCVNTLIKRYKSLHPGPDSRIHDEEAAMTPTKIGGLHISYFKPGENAWGPKPQQSHLKMTIVDGEVVVLGSGNLDRASWFTSQELGVAFLGVSLTSQVEKVVDKAMADRSKVIFDSSA